MTARIAFLLYVLGFAGFVALVAYKLLEAAVRW